MSECRCDNSWVLSVSMMFMMLVVVMIVTSDDEPLTPEQKAIKEQNWNDAKHSFFQFLSDNRNTLSLMSGMVVLMMGFWAWNGRKNYPLLLFSIMLGLGIFIWWSPDYSFMDGLRLMPIQNGAGANP